MRKRIFSSVFAFVLSILFILSGCQPTPAIPAIVNKADGKLEEKMQATPAPVKPYEAPAHWSETVEGEKLNIVIDTDVIVPDVNAYPVVKLEQQPFTQEQIDEMVHYFAGDAKLYLPHVQTKADYDAEIILAKRGTEVDGEYVVTEDSKAWVKELEKKRDAAPDDSPIIYTDTTLTYPKDEYGNDDVEKGKNYLSVCYQNEDGSVGNMAAVNDLTGNSRSCGFSYGRDEKLWYITETMYHENTDFDFAEEDSGWTGAGALFDKIQITQEEAQNMAQQVIDDLDIKDIVLVTAEKAVSIDVPEKCGYRFTYARQSGGIPAYKIEGGGYSLEEEPPVYSPPFTEETVRIDVSPDGIESFSWGGCAKVVETVSDNAALLPFEDIQQALKDQIFYKKSFNPMYESFGLSNFEVDVTSAKLRMGYIGVKDNEYQALMVPVWVFESTFGNDNAVLNKHQSHPDDTYVLNAIDGGVIEMKRYEFKDVPVG